MKKTLFVLAVVAIAISCGASNVCKIKGTADESLNGKTVYMYDAIKGKTIDSVGVVDGKFTFDCNLDSVQFVQLSVGRVRAGLFIEKGEVNVGLGNPSAVSGTPLNDAYSKYQKEEATIYEAYTQRVKELDSKTDAAAIESIQEEVMLKADNLKDRCFNDNKNNMLGVIMLSSIITDKSLAEVDSLINIVGDAARNFAPIQKVRETKVNENSTAEGRMFTDFGGIKPDGTPAKLSDWVGKGNYVLVDFWASWCGPCKAEVPVIKEVYNAYKAKGLVVLGANVWDKKGAFEKAVVDLAMPWAQICNFDNNIPTETYGILGIPHIILFGPDGTIVARGLRGEAMKEKLAEIYAK